MLVARDLTLAGRLDGISISLRAGEVTAICGPNGAGKSSLLCALAGLLVPQRGSAELDGASLAALAPRRRAQAIGYLAQDGEAAWDVSVETLVALGRLPWPRSAASDAAACEAAIAALQLEGLRSRPLSQLSGGERARALLARVVAGQPAWLLADEPLANLDLAHQQNLLARLRSLARGGMGVVLVLHDLAQAVNWADRVVVLKAGRMIAEGAPADALGTPVIDQAWGIRARWLGEPGQRALAIDPT